MQELEAQAQQAEHAARADQALLQEQVVRIDRDLLRILRLGHSLVMQSHANWPRGVNNSEYRVSIRDTEPCKLTERCSEF